MADAVLSAIPADRVAILQSAEDIAAFKSSRPSLAKVVLATNKAVPPLYKSLTMRFADRLGFAAALGQEALAELDVSEFPKLLVFAADGAIYTYDGNLVYICHSVQCILLCPSTCAPASIVVCTSLWLVLEFGSTGPSCMPHDWQAGILALGEKRVYATSKTPRNHTNSLCAA